MAFLIRFIFLSEENQYKMYDYYIYFLIVYLLLYLILKFAALAVFINSFIAWAHRDIILFIYKYDVISKYSYDNLTGFTFIILQNNISRLPPNCNLFSRSRYIYFLR